MAFYLAVIMTLSVAIVNGWTDAPNSIAACVSTNALSIKTAVKIAAAADFAGSLTIGLLSAKVTERISILSDFGANAEYCDISLFSAMLSVIIFAVSASYFGIPTSESHALLAGILGSSLAVNGGIDNINSDEWINVIFGLIISLFFGLLSGFCLSKFISTFLNINSYEKFFIKSQIISSVFTAYLHGAQDSQKFAGIVSTLLYNSGKFSFNDNIKIITTLICALFISLGTATGGNKIIKTVGNDIVSLNRIQGFSADISGLVCLLLSTLFGLPVSTTHIKTSAIIGAGLSNGVKEINSATVLKLFFAWILTFPVCSFLSFVITWLIIN